jgi:polygalacturonase
VDTCHLAGGGRVLLPAGRTYLSGTIRLKANVDLHLETGAILKGTTDRKAYGPQRALIVARDCNNVSITGGGTIDGDSRAWMDGLVDDIFRPKPGRPGLMYLRGCRQVTLTDVTIRNCAAWTVHLLGCEDVLIQGIRILNDLRVPNCDGIDPNRCRNAHRHCFIQAGDDGIVAKCTRESSEYGPCENMVVTGCTIISRSCAIKIGTESSGDFRNFVFDSCVIYGSNRGLGIQLRDSGTVENIVFSDIVVNTQSHGPLVGQGRAHLCHGGPAYGRDEARQDPQHPVQQHPLPGREWRIPPRLRGPPPRGHRAGQRARRDRQVDDVAGWFLRPAAWYPRGSV